MPASRWRAPKTSLGPRSFIAWVAADHGAALLTRDRDFEDIERVVPLERRRF
jgi:predicted nucleic acid-binding protein